MNLYIFGSPEADRLFGLFLVGGYLILTPIWLLLDTRKYWIEPVMMILYGTIYIGIFTRIGKWIADPLDIGVNDRRRMPGIGIPPKYKKKIKEG